MGEGDILFGDLISRVGVAAGVFVEEQRVAGNVGFDARCAFVDFD